MSACSDRHFNTLLNLLNDNGTPSFHDYSKSTAAPPHTVLDLGCGDGTWAIQAANYWKNAQVTGIDIVDLVDRNQPLPPNLIWKKGNLFVAPLIFLQIFFSDFFLWFTIVWNMIFRFHQNRSIWCDYPI